MSEVVVIVVVSIKLAVYPCLISLITSESPLLISLVFESPDLDSLDFKSLDFDSLCF